MNKIFAFTVFLAGVFQLGTLITVFDLLIKLPDSSPIIRSAISVAAFLGSAISSFYAYDLWNRGKK